MKNSNLRKLLNSEWNRINQRAEANKDSQSAIIELSSFYRNLTEEDRHASEAVIIEWALSNDPKKQFDGLALIDEYSIVSAVPALNRLSDRFRKANEPSSPYDLAKVNRIIKRLTRHSI